MKSFLPSCKPPMRPWAQLSTMALESQPCRFPGSPRFSVTASDHLWVSWWWLTGCFPASRALPSLAVHRISACFVQLTALTMLSPLPSHSLVPSLVVSLTFRSDILSNQPSPFDPFHSSPVLRLTFSFACSVVCVFFSLTLHFCLSPIPGLCYCLSLHHDYSPAFPHLTFCLPVLTLY